MENSAASPAPQTGGSVTRIMAYLDNIAVFVRVVELGNLSAAGRDMRISPAVASNRIKELEKHLGVRLFNRTTRQLMPTEHGNVFYSRRQAGAGGDHRGRSRRQRAVRPAARHHPRHRAARPRPPADRLRHPRVPRPFPRHRGAAAPLRPRCRHHEGRHRRCLPARRHGGFQPAHARHHGMRARAGRPPPPTSPSAASRPIPANWSARGTTA